MTLTVQPGVDLRDHRAQVFDNLFESSFRHDVHDLMDRVGGGIECAECKVQLFCLVVHGGNLPEAKGSITVSGNGGDAARNVIGAMNLVSTFALEMTVQGDAIRLSGAGYSDDAETRELLEDALRGILAAMRLASQEKPEVVSALRRFKVAADRNAVTISGTLDGETIRALSAAKAEREKAPGAESKAPAK